MSLFKKVMIIGLATMALGSAAMGDDKPSSCDAHADTALLNRKDGAPGGLTQDAKDLAPPIAAPAVQPATPPQTNT